MFITHALVRHEYATKAPFMAHNRAVQDEAQRMRKWAESKKAPHVSAVGHPATEAPNLDDRQERVDYMVSRLQANEQQ